MRTITVQSIDYGDWLVFHDKTPRVSQMKKQNGRYNGTCEYNSVRLKFSCTCIMHVASSAYLDSFCIMDYFQGLAN